MRIIFGFLFFLFFSVGHAQQAGANPDLYLINDIIPFFEFEKFRTYVWENGDRKTYCTNFRDNPHLDLSDQNMEIYFNPSGNVQTSSEESDYNIMFIVTRRNQQPVNYYLYMTEKANIYLYDYLHVIQTEEDKQHIRGELIRLIAAIRQVVNQ